MLKFKFEIEIDFGKRYFTFPGGATRCIDDLVIERWTVLNKSYQIVKLPRSYALLNRHCKH